MRIYPTLGTDRLFLRPFYTMDAREVRHLAGDKEVSDTLFTFDPSKPGVAEQWIIDQHEWFEQGRWVNFAITDLIHSIVMGSVGLDIDSEHDHAEIIYWLGREYWGHGYATEAACAVVMYGFEELKLHRIYARYLSRNIRSGRVLEKLGMAHEGHLRGHIKKSSIYEDLEIMGFLKEEYQVLKEGSRMYRL